MITRGYLEGWANDRGLVYVFDAEAEVHGPRALSSATVVMYAYRTEHTTLDLEHEYSKVEGEGVAAIRMLAASGALSKEGQGALVRFLDMFLERGFSADQAKVRVPVGIGDFVGGDLRMETLGMGDRLVLSRSMDENRISLAALKIEDWTWRVIPVDSGLVTGDGAAILWNGTAGGPLAAVTFPLSPTRLLVIGDLLMGVPVPFNQLVANRSKRWLIDHVDGVVSR